MGKLAEEVRVVRDVLDDIREDLSWITRNGIPGHPVQHTRVVRMARDPLAPDARDHFELRTYTLEPHGSSEISPKVFNELVSEIAEAMTFIGQEQPNMFLTALDDARAKLVAAIKDSATKPAMDKAVAIPQPSPNGRRLLVFLAFTQQLQPRREKWQGEFLPNCFVTVPSFGG